MEHSPRVGIGTTDLAVRTQLKAPGRRTREELPAITATLDPGARFILGPDVAADLKGAEPTYPNGLRASELYIAKRCAEVGLSGIIPSPPRFLRQCRALCPSVWRRGRSPPHRLDTAKPNSRFRTRTQ
ncbi:hypothetical protein GCM10009673_26810 [Nesterenkonia sandarakina]